MIDPEDRNYRPLAVACITQALKDLSDKDFIIALDAFLWLTDPGGGLEWADLLGIAEPEQTFATVFRYIAGGLDHAKKYDRRRFTACSGKELDALSGDEISARAGAAPARGD